MCRLFASYHVFCSLVVCAAEDVVGVDQSREISNDVSLLQGTWSLSPRSEHETLLAEQSTFSTRLERLLEQAAQPFEIGLGNEGKSKKDDSLALLERQIHELGSRLHDHGRLPRSIADVGSIPHGNLWLPRSFVDEEKDEATLTSSSTPPEIGHASVLRLLGLAGGVLMFLLAGGCWLCPEWAPLLSVLVVAFVEVVLMYWLSVGPAVILGCAAATLLLPALFATLARLLGGNFEVHEKLAKVDERFDRLEKIFQAGFGTALKEEQHLLEQMKTLLPKG